MTTMAPVRCAARVVAASTTSSMTSSVRGEPNTPGSGVLPSWARTFRISAWNTTMIPKTRYGMNVRSSQFTVSRCRSWESQ